MKKIQDIIEITDASPNDISTVAISLSEWQKTPDFNHFLRETPMTPEENNRFLRQKLSTDTSFMKIARIADRVIGILILHSFNKDHASLEESIRIDPKFSRRGIGTHLKKEVFREVLKASAVKRIISWHSAWNLGTFSTNRHCNGRILQFIENQTHLPNIGKITDDFQWEITNISEEIVNSETPRIAEEHASTILAGLKKHKIIL